MLHPAAFCCSVVGNLSCLTIPNRGPSLLTWEIFRHPTGMTTRLTAVTQVAWISMTGILIPLQMMHQMMIGTSMTTCHQIGHLEMCQGHTVSHLMSLLLQLAMSRTRQAQSLGPREIVRNPIQKEPEPARLHLLPVGQRPAGLDHLAMTQRRCMPAQSLQPAALKPTGQGHHATCQCRQKACQRIRRQCRRKRCQMLSSPRTAQDRGPIRANRSQAGQDLQQIQSVVELLHRCLRQQRHLHRRLTARGQITRPRGISRFHRVQPGQHQMAPQGQRLLPQERILRIQAQCCHLQTRVPQRRQRKQTSMRSRQQRKSMRLTSTACTLLMPPMSQQ